MPDFSKYLDYFHKIVPASGAATPATVTASKFSLGSTISGFSLSSANIFGILVLVCVLLLVLSLGRTRTLISLLAIYVAFTIQAIFPYFGWLQTTVTFTQDLAALRIGVLLIVYVISFLLLNRSIVRGKFNLQEASFIAVIIMGLTQLGFLASIFLNIAPDYQHYIPFLLLPYIASSQALFYWALVPLLLLIFQKND